MILQKTEKRGAYGAVKGKSMEFIISEMEDGTPPEEPGAAVFVEPAEAVGVGNPENPGKFGTGGKLAGMLKDREGKAVPIGSMVPKEGSVRVGTGEPVGRFGAAVLKEETRMN